MKDLKHIRRFNESDENLNISDVSISLFGLYSPEDELMFVHKTKEGAKKHQYEFEKEKPQKVKFSLEIDYEDKKPTSDKDIKSIVNYGQVVKLIKKLTKNKHYNFFIT